MRAARGAIVDRDEGSDARDGQSWRRLAGPLLLARAVGQLLEFGGWVVLARRLGASALGVTALAFLIARYGGLVADWGTSIGGARDVARDDEHLNATRAVTNLRYRLTMVLGVLFVAGCVVFGETVQIPMVAVIVMLGLSRDYISVGQHRGVRAAVPTVAQGGVLLAVALAAASPGRPAVAVGCGYAVSAVVSIALNRLPRRDVERVRSIAVRIDPWMMGAVMTNQILSSADTLVLGLLGTTAATGIYSAVYRLPNGWLAAVAILSGALLPISTRASSNPERYRRLRRSSLRISLASAAVLLAMIPVLYVAVPVIFGQAYRSGRGPMVVLLIASSVATAASPLHQFFLTTGSDRRYAGFLARSAITIVAAAFVLVPRFGMMGAAVATLCAHLVLAGSLLLATHRLRPDAA